MAKSVLRNIFLFAFLLIFSSFIEPKLVKTKVADDISVLIPKDWHPMDELDLRERYPSIRAPLAGYTNEDRLVDFSVNISATQWPDGDVELAQKFFKSSLYNLVDRVEIIEEGIREVKGQKFIFIEFESTIRGVKHDDGHQEVILSYNYLVYLLQPNRTLTFSFHCPRRLRAEWQETARKMMEGIKVK